MKLLKSFISSWCTWLALSNVWYPDNYYNNGVQATFKSFLSHCNCICW